MTFTLEVADDAGLAGVDLRRHRGAHVLLGKNACRRLAKLLPGLVKDNGTAAVVDFVLAEWLASPILRPEDEALALFAYAKVIGWERIGVALDRALAKITDDKPRDAGLLRAQLRRAAEIDFDKGGTGTEAYVALVADYYEVATSFPSGAGVDDVYDWMGLITNKDLVCPDGTMAAYGDLVPVLRERFDPDVALVANGPFDRLAKAITTSLAKDETDEYVALSANECALELSAWLRRALPVPDEISAVATERLPQETCV